METFLLLSGVFELLVPGANAGWGELANLLPGVK